MTERDNPMEPFSIIRQRFTKEVQDVGLNVHAFAVLPDLDPDAVHTCQVIVMADDEWKPADERDDAVSDPEFEKVIADAEKAEREQKQIEQREQLEQLREDLRKNPSKGIGLDG